MNEKVSTIFVDLCEKGSNLPFLAPGLFHLFIRISGGWAFLPLKPSQRLLGEGEQFPRLQFLGMCGQESNLNKMPPCALRTSSLCLSCVYRFASAHHTLIIWLSTQSQSNYINLPLRPPYYSILQMILRIQHAPVNNRSDAPDNARMMGFQYSKYNYYFE